MQIANVIPWANLVLFTNCSMETTDYCCKYLMLFTWATLVYSQVAQWIFSKLLKLDGKCRLIASHFYTNLPSVHSSRKLELAPPPCLSQIFNLSSHWTRTCKLELWINIRFGSTVRAPSFKDSFLESL